MNYLLPGSEPFERIVLLLQLTRINSEPTVAALIEVYANCLEPERAAVRFNIELSNLSRAQKRLEKAAGIVEQIKEIDWQKLKTNMEKAS